MPRTAPTVDSAAITEKAVSISFIDATGDERSVRLIVPAAATDSEIEAVVAATVALSNANVWRVKVEQLYVGAKDASQALSASYQSVYDNIVLLAKESSVVTQNAYVPAPLGSLVLSGDVVDTSVLDYQTWRDDVITLLAGGYNAQSVRFTERREKNDSVPA